jgi:hypothetical protein
MSSTGFDMKRNYGNRVEGPWVFGMVIEKISEVETKESIQSELPGKVVTP